MSAIPLPRSCRSSLAEPALFDGEMVELALLLPRPQAEALETAAQHQGVTTGQMLRHIIRDFCARKQRRGQFIDADTADPWALE
jgi:hypothetical protein